MKTVRELWYELSILIIIAGAGFTAARQLDSINNRLASMNTRIKLLQTELANLQPLYKGLSYEIQNPTSGQYSTDYTNPRGQRWATNSAATIR